MEPFVQKPDIQTFLQIFSVPENIRGFSGQLAQNAKRFRDFLNSTTEGRRQGTWDLLCASLALGQTVYFTGTAADRGLRIGTREAGATSAGAVLAICRFPVDGEPFVEWSGGDYPVIISRWPEACQPIFCGDELALPVEQLINSMRQEAITKRGRPVESLWNKKPFNAAIFANNLSQQLPIRHPEGGESLGADDYISIWREKVSR